jgi:hypothetical protein
MIIIGYELLSSRESTVKDQIGTKSFPATVDIFCCRLEIVLHNRCSFLELFSPRQLIPFVVVARAAWKNQVILASSQRSRERYRPVKVSTGLALGLAVAKCSNFQRSPTVSDFRAPSVFFEALEYSKAIPASSHLYSIFSLRANHRN